MRCPDRDRYLVGGPERVTDYAASAGRPVLPESKKEQANDPGDGPAPTTSHARRWSARWPRARKLFDTAYTSGKGHRWSD